MSVPDSVTVLDLSGKYVMNKKISDDADKILKLQGVGYLTRTAISLATITINLNHYKDADDGVERIDIQQTVTGGIRASDENRKLWWKDKESHDAIFGDVVGKSRRVKVEELEDEYLKKEWTPHTIEHGVIQSLVYSDTPKSGTTWTANQTWGIEVVNGETRYTRHIKFTGPKGEDVEKRLVYDYIGPHT